MKRFLTDNDISEYTTVGELAARHYSGFEYDCALPQVWTDHMETRYGVDVRGHFVWLYPDSGLARLSGCPAPITQHGVDLLIACNRAECRSRFTLAGSPRVMCQYGVESRERDRRAWSAFFMAGGES